MPALFPFAVWARRCRGGLSALLSPVILIALLLALFTVGTAHAQSKSGAALPAAELPSPNGITPPGDDPAPAPQDYAYAVGMSAPASMVAGSTANVTVTMRNGGTTTWSGTVSNPYWLGLANPLNSSIWGVSRVRVANTVAPNGQSTFGFTITAPTTPGNYSFDWRMLRQTGTWFGETATHTITVTPIPVYDAQLTGATVPATMTAGGMYNVSLTFKNTGNVTWTQNENYRIGSNSPVDNVTFGNNRLNMNVASVAPGQSASFSFPVQAPATPDTYLFDWGMLWEWHFRFGQTSAVAVTVVAAPLKPTITVTRNLSPIAEQAFTTTWKTTDASSVTRVCTASGSGYTVNEALAVNGTRTETAQVGWVGYPSSCTWTASGAGGTVSHVETMTTLPAGSGVTYIHTDGLGSPVARTNTIGQVLSRTRYEAYGQAAQGTAKTIGFTGHVNDADTGLTYMQQRYYDPVAGRFLSIDPVVTDANTGGSFNRYAYANNSPYKYVDPDGRNPAAIPAGVGGTLVCGPVCGGIAAGTVLIGGTYAGKKIVDWWNSRSEPKRSDSTVPPAPDTLVGEQGDKAGPAKNGKRHTSGPLTPENGGTGDAKKDFDKLTGGSGKAPDSSDSRSSIPGVQVGDNGIWIRPDGKDGPRIEIPAAPGKLPETLHYPPETK